MIRLLKYTKPYMGLLILAIVLLFAQANFELALPDYLSDVVNTGIQQGGVDSAVPVAIRQSEMERALIFMSDENKTFVLDSYTLVDKNSTDYSKYLKKYPVLENESVYTLNKVSKADMAQLNPIMGRAILVVSGIKQLMVDPSRAEEMGIVLGFNLTELPQNVSLFMILSQLSKEQLVQIINSINERFEVLGENMVIQAAVIPVRLEYDALGMNTDALQTNYVFRVGGLMLVLTLLSAACTIIVGYAAAKIGAGIARNMRRDVFETIESFSSTEFDTFSTASLITRSTNDITQIQMVVMMLVRMVFYAPIIGIGGVFRALDKATSMSWIIGVAVVMLISLIMVIFYIALPKFKSIQKLVDRLNLVARENLSGMMVIRAFNMQDFEEDRFDRANVDLTAVSLFINRLMVVVMPIMMLIMNGLMITIIWVGAHQVSEANMQVGDMMAFMQYAMQIVMAFLMLSIMFIILPRAAVSADRISEVLETEPVIKDTDDMKKFPEPFEGTIEFRDVSFRYPRAEGDAIHGITFTAHPGQTTAFIGATGAGKTTVVNLILRFYEVTIGSILINGVDIREVSQHDLREKIGYVPQKSVLFSGTIESNLRYADENAGDEAVQSAITIAQATDFISAKDSGLAFEIAQGGMNVSGGQKQRLSIARALVKKPPIYILDDSFSALDFKTDAALRKALKKNAGNSTVLIITQRISTIMNAEQIIVLEEGKIVGKGTHAELMGNCDTYREIALSQLNLEEVA
ncbi:MAG: ABC transporter ATP-binding protein [Candidatus Odinarchaeota archaeon]